jgi:hypothetical protein
MILLEKRKEAARRRDQKNGLVDGNGQKESLGVV